MRREDGYLASCFPVRLAYNERSLHTPHVAGSAELCTVQLSLLVIVWCGRWLQLVRWPCDVCTWLVSLAPMKKTPLEDREIQEHKSVSRWIFVYWTGWCPCCQRVTCVTKSFQSCHAKYLLTTAGRWICLRLPTLEKQIVWTWIIWSRLKCSVCVYFWWFPWMCLRLEHFILLLSLSVSVRTARTLRADGPTRDGIYIFGSGW